MYSLIWSAAYAISTLSSTILYTVYCRYMYIYIERTGRVPRCHSEDVKTRRREQPPAASQRRHREDASSSPSGVAALRSREDARRSAWQRRSVATPRRREQPPQRRRNHGVPQLHIRKSKRECLAFFLAKFSLMTPSAMPSDFRGAKNLLVLQSSSSSKILLYRKTVRDTG
jgi:hypothetical protein